MYKRQPLANKTVTVRGGVYKNGGYCQTALLGSRAGALVSGITGDTYTTDAAGNITVYLDSTPVSYTHLDVYKRQG